MIKKSFVLLLVLLISSISLPTLADVSAVGSQAATGAATSTPTPPKPPLIIPPPPTMSAQSYILMDADTGQILASEKMDDRRAPASLTKLMTVYLIFNALETGQIKLTDLVRISETAWKTGGSRMFIVAGSQVSVADLIQGIIVESGNDATVAMAEYIGGSQEGFVALMNQQAQKLGMVNTHFDDVNGLPAPDHYSSAHDLALLAQAIIKNFPNQYHWFSQKYFMWDNIKQTNRNWLLFRDPSVDGLKTGFTDAAGYCLVASAKRDGMRLVSVLMGAASEVKRIDESERLLEYGFRFYQTYKIYPAGTVITNARIWGGTKKESPLGIAKDLYLMIPKGQYQDLKINVQLNQTIHAPVSRGISYGNISISLNDKALADVPVIALEDNPRGGIWTRFSDYVSLTVHKFFNKKGNG